MMAGLRLESFSPRIAAPPPPITAADLAEARSQGFAAGRTAAADDAAAGVAAALRDLSAAIAEAEAGARGRDAAFRRDTAVLVRAVVARIAPRLRAEALAERVVEALAGHPAAAPRACRIRCEADLAGPLAAALEGAGIAGVELAVAPGPLQVEVPGGELRIDMAAFEAALDRMVADFAEGED